MVGPGGDLAGISTEVTLDAALVAAGAVVVDGAVAARTISGRLKKIHAAGPAVETACGG